MPRRLKIATRELGPLELFVIYEREGLWEEAWRPIQGDAVSALFTTISKEVYDHALLGWTKPLIDALGIEPKGALRKLPKTATRCFVRDRCPFYDKKTCTPTSSKLPWCYEADVGEDEQKRHLTSEAIRFWRERVYVVVVLGGSE